MRAKHPAAILLVLVLLATAGSALLLACTRSAQAPAAMSVKTVMEQSYGAAPAAGWKWGVAEINTGAEERTEDTNRHGFAWVFYVIRGSMETGGSDGKKTSSAGEAIVVAARQDHTHRFLPQSQVLVFRPADRPFGEFHRGTRLWESDAPLPLTAGQNYSVRIREFTLPQGAESTVEANWGYVMEGTLTLRLGDAVSTVPAGKAFGLPPGVRQVLSNGEATPVRIMLTDLTSRQ